VGDDIEQLRAMRAASAELLTKAVNADDPSALDALYDAAPADRRDRFLTLLSIYQLHRAPLDKVGPAVRWQHHPAVSTLKQRCEAQWLAELEELELPDDIDDGDPADALRSLAARDRLPRVYKWLAREAELSEVVQFLALEGGPDADFDDLVAACQAGLVGSAKMELATNYWDEMGNGDPKAVHTELHRRLVEALDLPHLSVAAQPTAALARMAFGGLLATNRWFQPEMLGALGLIELQAGPRSRLVLHALQRCGAPSDALRFYEVHADVDPRHGKDWLDKAIVPSVAQHPDWGVRIVRGALWRSEVNDDFLDDVTARFVTSTSGRWAAA
jgi:hypothetical protein